MENKTQHMRRMRLRLKYWRVTPESEPLFKLGKREPKMCVDSQAARELIAAASALLFKVDHMTSEQFSRGEERPEREALRNALVAAIAAGVGR